MNRTTQTLLLLAGLWMAGGCAAKPAPDPVVVGHLSARSGPLQAVGLAEEQGILLAVEEANVEPVAGRTFEVLHVDSRGDADQAGYQAVRLVTINRAAALLGGHGSAAAEKLSRVAENYKLLCVTPAWLPPDALAPFSVSVGLTPAERGRTLAKFAVQKLKKQRLVALADVRDPAATALVTAFAAELPKEATLAQQTYAATDKLAQLAVQVVRENPDAVLIAGRGEDLPAWRAALKLAGLKPDVPVLFGGDDVSLFAMENELDEQAPLYFTTAFVAEGGPKEAQEFVEKFQKRFGRPPDAAAALAYDSALALFDSIRRTQSLQGTKLREDLVQRQDFAGTTGNIAFVKDGTAQRAAFVVQRTEKGVKVVWGAAEKP